MRHLLLICVVALIATAVPATASAQDRAFGSFQTTFGPDETLAFDAVGGPLAATGFVRYDFYDGETNWFDADVTCLRVIGNTATIGAVITNTSVGYSSIPGDGLTFTVQDNGPNGQGDLHSFLQNHPEPLASTCTPLPPDQLVGEGDIVVGCEKAKAKKKAGPVPVCRDKAP